MDCTCVKIGIHSMVSIIHFSWIYTLQCYNCNFYLQFVTASCNFKMHGVPKQECTTREDVYAMPSVRSLNCYSIVYMATPCTMATSINCYTHLFNCENESTSACKPMCSTDFFALTVLLIIHLRIKLEKIWQVWFQIKN